MSTEAAIAELQAKMDALSANYAKLSGLLADIGTVEAEFLETALGVDEALERLRDAASG